MARLLSVKEVARELGLSDRRVRALVQSDRLAAARVGHGHVIDSASVARLKRIPAAPGRPMSAGNAWALLALLSGDAPDWLRQSADWRLHQLLGLGSLQVEAALQRAESRSQLHRWRLLAADLPKLANEFQIVASGLSAREPGLHVPSGPADGVDAYVAAPVLKSISRRFKPQVESERPNVILRVPTHSWILDHHVAPPVVVAADLLDHREPRVARAASDLLGELVDAHRHS